MDYVWKEHAKSTKGASGSDNERLYKRHLNMIQSNDKNNVTDRENVVLKIEYNSDPYNVPVKLWQCTEELKEEIVKLTQVPPWEQKLYLGDVLLQYGQVLGDVPGLLDKDSKLVLRQGSSGKFKVIVLHKSEKFDIMVQNSEIVRRVKHKICRQLGIIANKQRLFSNGIEMADTSYLGFYHVPENGYLRLSKLCEPSTQTLSLLLTAPTEMVSLSISPLERIASVKEIIQKSHSIPFQQQRLELDGQELYHQAKICDYDINIGNVIDVIKVEEGLVTIKVLYNEDSRLLHVWLSDTVGILKDKIELAMHIPVNQQQLTLKDTKLENDDVSLALCEITDRSIVKLVQSQREKLQLKIFFCERQFTFYIDKSRLESTTVKDLKRDIKQRTDIPVNLQRLIINQKEVGNIFSLHECKLQNGDRCDLVLDTSFDPKNAVPIGLPIDIEKEVMEWIKTRYQGFAVKDVNLLSIEEKVTKSKFKLLQKERSGLPQELAVGRRTENHVDYPLIYKVDESLQTNEYAVLQAITNYFILPKHHNDTVDPIPPFWSNGNEPTDEDIFQIMESSQGRVKKRIQIDVKQTVEIPSESYEMQVHFDRDVVTYLYSREVEISGQVHVELQPLGWIEWAKQITGLSQRIVTVDIADFFSFEKKIGGKFISKSYALCTYHKPVNSQVVVSLPGPLHSNISRESDGDLSLMIGDTACSSRVWSASVYDGSSPPFELNWSHVDREHVPHVPSDTQMKQITQLDESTEDNNISETLPLCSPGPPEDYCSPRSLPLLDNTTDERIHTIVQEIEVESTYNIALLRCSKRGDDGKHVLLIHQPKLHAEIKQRLTEVFATDDIEVIFTTKYREFSITKKMIEDINLEIKSTSFDIERYKKLLETIRSIEGGYFCARSDLQAILPSCYSIRGDKVQRELCIHLFVLNEDFIPLGEQEFPTEVDGYKICMMSGYFEYCMDTATGGLDAPCHGPQFFSPPTSCHKPYLLHGLEVGRHTKTPQADVCGTVGMFVKFGPGYASQRFSTEMNGTGRKPLVDGIRDRYGFITSGHLFQLQDRVQQPGIRNAAIHDRRDPNHATADPNRVCGIVQKKVHVNISDQQSNLEVGVDAALIEINAHYVGMNTFPGDSKDFTDEGEFNDKVQLTSTIDLCTQDSIDPGHSVFAFGAASKLCKSRFITGAAFIARRSLVDYHPENTSVGLVPVDWTACKESCKNQVIIHPEVTPMRPKDSGAPVFIKGNQKEGKVLGIVMGNLVTNLHSFPYVVVTPIMPILNELNADAHFPILQ